MLSSFVAPEDYGNLLEIFKKAYDGTLRDSVSVLLISGLANSGKSTLLEIMKKLAPGGIYDIDPHRRLEVGEVFQKFIVYAEDTINMSGGMGIRAIEYFHEKISSGYVRFYKGPYNEPQTIEIPGTLVLTIDCEYDLIMRKSKRKVVQLYLPNKFNLDEGFANNIVDICVKEFLTLIAEEAEETIKTSKPPTFISVLNPKYEGVLL